MPTTTAVIKVRRRNMIAARVASSLPVRRTTMIADRRQATAMIAVHRRVMALIVGRRPDMTTIRTTMTTTVRRRPVRVPTKNDNAAL